MICLDIVGTFRKRCVRSALSREQRPGLDDVEGRNVRDSPLKDASPLAARWYRRGDHPHSKHDPERLAEHDTGSMAFRLACLRFPATHRLAIVTPESDLVTGSRPTSSTTSEHTTGEDSTAIQS